MKIKTIELAGHALDWAVAVAEGWEEWEADGFFAKDGDFSHALFLHNYKPSSDWAQGGPIIERKIVCIDCEAGRKRWKAYAWRGDGDLQSAIGETPLIASMRCYVASRLGEFVEVPNDIV